MGRRPLSTHYFAYLILIPFLLVSWNDREVNTFEKEMILIEGGTFIMGHDPSIPDDRVSDDEMPAHEVKVPTFYLGKYEVTNAEFVVFLNEKGNQPEGKIRWIDIAGRFDQERCHIIQDGSSFSVEPGFERYPVNYLSWHGAMAYVYWLKEKTGLPYRLPTEAEWEYAAKGGAQATKPYLTYSGSDQIEEVAWHSGNSGYISHEVGSKKPNALGLYDMSGNMLEWCLDVWNDSYEGAPTDGSAWLAGEKPERKIVRGGAWIIGEAKCRVVNRMWHEADMGLNDMIGFRVAMDKQ